MNKNHLWTIDNIGWLLSLFIGQVLLFYTLIKTDDSGPLGGLIIFFWAGGTAFAVIVHLIILLFSRRKSLFGVAFLISVLFWTIAWSSYNYLERTKSTRERASTSDDILKWQGLIKTRLEKSLRKKNIPHEWLQDSLCFKIYRVDGSCYYMSGGFHAGGGISASEKVTSRLNLKDTSAWLKGLTTVIPLLNNEQLSQLHKSLKNKSFCLSRAYEGYSSAFPCWRTVVSQRYDSLTEQLTTNIQYPDETSENYNAD